MVQIDHETGKTLCVFAFGHGRTHNTLRLDIPHQPQGLHSGVSQKLRYRKLSRFGAVAVPDHLCCRPRGVDVTGLRWCAPKYARDPDRLMSIWDAWRSNPAKMSGNMACVTVPDMVPCRIWGRGVHGCDSSR